MTLDIGDNFVDDQFLGRFHTACNGDHNFYIFSENNIELSWYELEWPDCPIIVRR